MDKKLILLMGQVVATGSINSSNIKILLIIIVGLFFFPSAILLEAKFKKRNKENVPSLHGFYLERPIVAVSNIIKSGPPRGSIPAITRPRFIPVTKVRFLRANDMVTSIVRNGIARVYPHLILIWHEVVNDVFLGLPIVVSYSPLIASAMVFQRTVFPKRMPLSLIDRLVDISSNPSTNPNQLRHSTTDDSIPSVTLYWFS